MDFVLQRKSRGKKPTQGKGKEKEERILELSLDPFYTNNAFDVEEL